MLRTSLVGTMRLFLLVFTLAAAAFAEELRTVGDDELLQLIKTQDRLIVLFTKPNCEPCKALAREVSGLTEDFEKQLNAMTISAENSHLVRLYSPSKEPALIFFRHGVPLLYSGEADENEIYPFLEKNQEPAVKELNDQIFEHMTQAASGATTGDWLVMFYSASCVDCQRLQALWEGVGATLKGRVNVARVDTAGPGQGTAKRFKVNKLPTFIFLRHGKQYRYDLPKNDVKSFVSFAQDWYKHAKGEPVPILASPFDELLTWSVETIRFFVELGLEILTRHPWIWQIGVFGFGLVIVTGAIALYMASKRKPAKDAKKEKKSK